MTKKNLVAVVIAALLSILLTGFNTPTATQAKAKSVTPEATQSVILPSTKVASLVESTENRTHVKVVPKQHKKVTKVTHKSVRVSKPTAKKALRVYKGSANSWFGAGYNPQWENVRKCIVNRESHGNYAAKNRYSSAAGAYQFILGTSNSIAKMMGRSDLVGTSARYWSKIDQDHAFWVLWKNGKGRSNWNYPPKQCW